MTPLTSPSPEERARHWLVRALGETLAEKWHDSLASMIEDVLAEAAEAARRAERERCAKIVRLECAVRERAAKSGALITEAGFADRIATAIEAGTEEAGNVE